jgi:serine protease AprX
MASVPPFLVEFFLLGRTSPGELKRFTQDAGIVPDAWFSFADDISVPQRILLSPVDGLSAIDAAAVVHEALRLYRTVKDEASAGDGVSRDALRQGIPSSRAWTGVSPLENFVAVTLYFDELIRVILPLTAWWCGKSLGMVQDPERGGLFQDTLRAAIVVRLGHSDVSTVQLRARLTDADDATREFPNWKVLEATPIAALIGAFIAVARNPSITQELAPSAADRKAVIANWVAQHAAEIADAAAEELARPTEAAVSQAMALLRTRQDPPPKALLQRVFLDRASHLADADAISTVKADAADRVFRISCRSLTWAIIDSGISALHPAFDEFEPGAEGKRTGRSRVRATFDLTMIHRIRNFDLTTQDEALREAVIHDIILDLKKLPGERDADFEAMASENLAQISAQLRRRLLPDWALIEPLVRVREDDGTSLTSDHGTHVAGILAGDWRTNAVAAGAAPAGVAVREEPILTGICPDISIYDLRVIHPQGVRNTEFAVIAALEFVRYLNSRASGPPVIHGVNISLSIPHEVRNYGCGATPICVACDDLVQSGVVVVAAAGNRGWNEQEIGFGNFVFCSITDPGNAQHVITVGATHRLKPHSYGVSYFSSRGPTGDGRVKPDLVAPGEKIRGPIRGDADDELDGTSMAAPFVSGAAAMLMARNRELIRNPLRIKTILCESATDLGRERYFQGHGLVDVLRALQSI